MNTGLKWLLVLVWGLTAALPIYAQARKPASRASDLCVDVVTLRSGKSVRGLIVAGDGSANAPWLMAVEREPLRQDNLPLYERQAKLELQKAIQAYEELKQRIEQELTQPGVEAGYKKFLESELLRIQPLLASIKEQGSAQSRFMWLELTSKECTNLRRAPADAQRVAVWAWSENLSDVTKRDRADLDRELVQAKVDVKLKLPDLSSELPPRPEPEDTCHLRLATVRYTLAGGIVFQGSNGVYVQAGTGKAAGMAELAPLIQKMMGGSIEELLADLDPAAKSSSKQNNGNWFASVTPQAESLGKREFRITRLDQDPSGQAATVETALVVKLPQRGWQVVWSAKQTRQAADVAAAAEERIADDPQVKTVLSAISALGVNAEAEIKKAIRFGAATMAAQQAADSDFLNFRDRYANRFDGPPMN